MAQGEFGAPNTWENSSSRYTIALLKRVLDAAAPYPQLGPYRDVVSCVARLQEFSNDTAIRFLNSFDETLSFIQNWPELSPIQLVDGWRYTDLRVRTMAHFRDYLVFYRITSDEIEIFRVLHGSRDLNLLFGGDFE